MLSGIERMYFQGMVFLCDCRLEKLQTTTHIASTEQKQLPNGESMVEQYTRLDCLRKRSKI
jgi:hypothetical protein